jgi:hypothetical protein
LPSLVERIRESGSATSHSILEGVLRNPNFRPAPWA